MRGVTFAMILASALAAVAGCDGPARSAEAGGQLPASPRAASGPFPRRVDGFESGSLADFWRPGGRGMARYEVGAIVVSADYARSGKRSARITVKEGDIEQVGDDGMRTERAELDSGNLPLLGRDAWYGFSLLLLPDFPVVDDRLVISQVKQSDVEGSPLLGQRFRAGRHSLTMRLPGATSAKTSRLPDLRLGRWMDMVYHLRYSPGEDGRIEVWMDGQRVLSYEGPTASKQGNDRFYHKVGLYRDRWKEPMTLYVDNYTVGESFDQVDPSKFDQRR
jgi:hypothetical protein